MKTETSLLFAADHPVFAGHFPDRPVVPGALLLDEVVHAVVAGGSNAGEVKRCQIVSVKFFNPVLPGDTVQLCCTFSESSATRFDMTCRGLAVAAGTLLMETGS